MNILDVIILVCLIPAIIQGIRKGFIEQVISTVSLIIGIWLSAKFADVVGQWLGGFLTASEQTLKFVAFIIILVAVCVGLLLLGKIIEKLVQLITLGWVNRLLGVVFAIAKCFLILGVVLLLFEYLNNAFHMVNQEYIDSSRMYQAVKWVADTVFPYITSMLNIPSHA
ncbi:MAG: CvpA family protein [Bacteroidales bacterium]|nr:CvpA family protein [Bacteroidales bacterium]